MLHIGLVSYNFPHRKTQDFIFRLLAEGFSIDVILAQDYQKLNIPSSKVRSKVKFDGLIHPQTIADNFGIEYRSVNHDSQKMVDLIQDFKLDIGVISGARILKKPVIDAFGKGIINFHPGMLPEARGLDALKWSILKEIPLGMTSHIIDEKIDAGKVLCKERISIDKGDTLFDFNEKIYSKQLNNIVPSIRHLENGKFVREDFDHSAYHSKMAPDKERQVVEALPAYIEKFSNL